MIDTPYLLQSTLKLSGAYGHLLCVVRQVEEDDIGLELPEDQAIRGSALGTWGVLRSYRQVQHHISLQNSWCFHTCFGLMHDGVFKEDESAYVYQIAQLKVWGILIIAFVFLCVFAGANIN